MVWVGLVIAVGVVGTGIWWWLYRMSLPKVSGTLKGPGLGAPVEIIRDRWGIPHIYAQSLRDAVYAQGYVHAQDRLWQMELQRRIAAGRLSEIFGAQTVEADRFLRRLGLRRAAEAEAAAADHEEQLVLEAYAGGVNAAIAEAGGRLPLEFRLLGIKPAPWTPSDTLSWTKVMSLNLSLNWEEELLRMQLAQRVGPEHAARLETHYPAGHPLTTAPGLAGAADSAEALLGSFAAARQYLNLSTPSASNNWVVAGSRTETGKPLLANDPHLTIGIPSTWYEAHLVCPETDVTGSSLPGVPGIVLGHNRHVAWGFTNSMADAADLFIEKWHPTESAVEFEGQWEPVTVIDETIRVKGQPEVVERVYITRHGPVMAGGPLGAGPALALRWMSLDAGHPARAVVAMNTAGGAAELRDAMCYWNIASQNVVFADTAGNIGYIMAGLVPKRKNGTGLTPVPGWTGEYEWEGCVPQEELPQLWNPESGFIVTANNKVVDHTFPHHISWDYMPGYRAERIQQLLTEKPKVTPEDFRRIQMDVFCAPGVEFAQHCRSLEPADALEQKALELLRNWDGHLTAESTGGTIYEVMLTHAVRRAYLPILGEDLFHAWMGKGTVLSPANSTVGRSTTALLRELKQRDPGFFAIGRPSPESATDPWQDLLAASLTEAVSYLKQRLGADPGAWQWGKLHRLKLAHPMGAVKPLNLIFNGPEVGIGGDTATPLQTAYVPHQPYGASAWAPSYRQIVDLADLTRSLSVHPVGQSGHPGSKHYLDLFPLWSKGEFHPMLFSREAVEAHAEAKLQLTPTGK